MLYAFAGHFSMALISLATQPTTTLFPRKYKADDQTGAYSQPAIRLSLFQLQRWACVYRKQPQKGRRNRCVVASLFLTEMTRRSAHGALILQLHAFPYLKCLESPQSRIDQGNCNDLTQSPLVSSLPPHPNSGSKRIIGGYSSTLARSGCILAPRDRFKEQRENLLFPCGINRASGGILGLVSCWNRGLMLKSLLLI